MRTPPRGAAERYTGEISRYGVDVGFTMSGDGSHYARKMRQLAGNAVSYGMPWEAALAGLTRVPANTFGVSDEVGAIAVGRRADLALPSERSPWRLCPESVPAPRF